ncbi:MAG TPA: TerC family protein [Candidatus Omnitrophota bacterium]|nr:TerC family protein [Candidatus Omnitrophota bacterium]
MNPAVHFVWFTLLIIGILSFDLLVVQRKQHTIEAREAILWTLFYVALALLFNAGIFVTRGHDAGLKFLTGYLIEYSLSVDNLFVFLLIFSYFKVPSQYQHRVLFWGIVGAQIMRAVFILAGVALIHKFHWIIYVFGAFLIYTGFKLLKEKDKEIHPEKNPVVKLCGRYLPMTSGYVEGRFFVKQGGRRLATLLFLVLLVIETTDVVFAVDSIPAIFGITLDPFIVYTSNMFAILGLRSLYFALAAAMRKFHYLSYGLSFILVFIGLKMLIADFYHIPVGIALGVVAGILSLSVVLSVLRPEEKS